MLKHPVLSGFLGKLYGICHNLLRNCSNLFGKMICIVYIPGESKHAVIVYINRTMAAYIVG